MAQLTDDCFAFDGPLITAAAALDHILTKLVCVAEPEPCPVSKALGRILAQDVIAPLPIPPYANSAVDGFAVFHALPQAGPCHGPRNAPKRCKYSPAPQCLWETGAKDQIP